MNAPAAPRHLKLLACEILFREVCHVAARSRNVLDVTFLPKGLHDIGTARMAARLQEEIDRVDPSRFEALLLGYGLCNNGIAGLHARLPLVVPRAHDCITLLLGSRQAYEAYFHANPGTYFKSPGWIERSSLDAAPGADTIPSQLGMGQTIEELTAKYGADNAKYLMETMGSWTTAYTKFAYIDSPVGDFAEYKERTRRDAAGRGWTYEELPGSLALLQRLVDGDWDPEDFLVVPPGQAIRPTYGPEIVGPV